MSKGNGAPMNNARAQADALLGAVGPVLVATAFVVMFFVSWRRWPDVIIDFGRELYVPWRLTEGDVLYRDLAVFFGPLSAYFNAMCFNAFGPSLMTLAIVNAVILAAFSAMLYWVLNAIAGRLSAVVGGIVFLMVFGFGHLQGFGNYNFIAPYSHELTHGTMLGVACLVVLARAMHTQRRIEAAAAGLLLGLTFLTKLEPFVATFASVAAGWILTLATSRNSMRARLICVALMFAGAIVPPLVSVALLSTAMSSAEAMQSTLGSWVHVGNDAVRELPFYRVIMGTNKIGLNVALMLKWTGIVLIVPALAAIVTGFLRVQGRAGMLAGAVCAVVTIAGLWWSRESFAWEQIARPLPLFAFAAAAGSAAVMARESRHSTISNAALLRFMFCTFALVMLLKMVLNARFSHYGFVLAMPATLVCIAAMLDWLPRWIERHPRTGWILRGSAMGVITVWLISMQHYNLWNLVPVKSVGEGRDEFLTDQPRAEVINAVVTNLKRVAPPGATLAVLPEGVMLNYLTRLPAGTKYFNFLPPELAMFGEDEILAALQASPPDFIAIVHRDSPEYGTRFFGRDFGTLVSHWIEQNYARIGLAGDEPSVPTSRFGIMVLKRTDVEQ